MARPSKYKPEYCEALLDHMEKGYSFESFAGTLRVNRDTLYEWVATHAEFSDTKKTGLELSRLYWERKAIDHMNGKVSKEDVEIIQEAVKEHERKGPLTIRLEGNYFNNTLWIFNMKNRFKTEWRDKQELEHSGPDGKPLQAQPVTLIIPENYRNKKKNEKS